jgi:cytochrome c peroxidase
MFVRIRISNNENVFHTQLIALITQMKAFEEAIDNRSDLKDLKQNFTNARLAYKRASIFIDYFFPSLNRSVNGPDLKYAEDDNPDVIHEPHGFQVMERLLYTDFDSSSYLYLEKEARMLGDIFIKINEQPGLDFKFRDVLMFDAMKAGVIRMVALGITGFDSPLSLNSLPESSAVLSGLNDILSGYKDDESVKIVKNARQFLSSAGSFNAFDRLKFIRQFADPLYASLVTRAEASRFLLPEERRPLNQASKGIFAKDLFDINFFSPNQRYRATPERTSLGKLLFYDSILSINNNRSCASCHKPALAFTDGLRTPVAVSDTILLKRNTPTLLNAAVQTRFFYDSRTSTLENQLNSVVHNAGEMNGSLASAITRIQEHEKYSAMFKNAYPDDKVPVTEYNIANSISSYIRSLPSRNSRFDRYMRGEEELTEKEKKGFNLFAGKGKCATCHYIPLFNGLVPPQFTETESEIIGTPGRNRSGKLIRDDDEGKYLFTRSDIHKFAFKTPTLRNAAITAPYMHNGVFKTIGEVLDFYNKGGGAGTHTAHPNETLPTDELHLTKKEMKSITAFIAALTDVDSLLYLKADGTVKN